MTFKHIHTTTVDGVGRITLDKEPLNVLNIEMIKEINAALDGFKEDRTLKLLVFQAKGKAFSAGVDVGEHMGELCAQMIGAFDGIFRRINLIEAPVLSLVKGAALGGGCELAVYCDMVLASEKAKFGQPEIQVGVFPPIAALEFPLLIHMNKALELILTGEIIKAQEAKDLGLVNQVYPLESFDEEAERFIQRFTRLSAPVIRMAKKATYIGATRRSSALKDIEKIYLEELMMTEDASEGLKAFLEKRKPQWKER